MAGKVSWQYEIKSNIEQVIKKTQELERKMNSLENDKHNINLSIDTKKLENIINNLDKMLSSLGKGTGDFKEFENLSKQLNNIISEVQSLNKAFGNINNSSVNELLSSIKNIDSSLMKLSNRIIDIKEGFDNVDKNVGRFKEIKNAVDDITKSTEKLDRTQKSMNNNRQRDLSVDSSSVIKQQEKIREELKDTADVAENTRDIISQVGKKEIHTVQRKDKKGKVTTHKEGSFSFVERLQDGQTQTVLSTYNEKTQKWEEEVLNLSTAFEKVGNEIIKLDNEITKLENARDKTKAEHPEYNTSADDALIAQAQERQNILLHTLSLYDKEKGYQYEISKFNKSRLENAERLNSLTEKQNNLLKAKEAEKANKLFDKEWKDAINFNEELDKALKNSHKLFSSQSENLPTEYSKLEKDIKGLNRQLKNGEISIDEYNSKVKSLVSNYSKLVDIQQKRDKELYDVNAKETEKADSEIDKFQSTINKFKLKPDDEHSLQSWKDEIKNLEALVESYTNTVNEAKAAGESLGKNNVKIKNASDDVYKQITKMNNIPQGNRGYSDLQVTKAMEKINSELEKYSAMSPMIKAKIKALYDEMSTGNLTKPISEYLSEVYKLIQGERLAGRAHKSFMSILKEKFVYGIGGELAGMFGLYDFINLLKNGIGVVREFDTALAEMRKVSDETVSSLKAYQSETFDIADSVGSTAITIQNSTAEWMRLGESINKAAESAEASNILFNVSEFESIDDATESLISMSQAYKELGKMDIINVANKLGNEFAISTEGIATALKDSASALKTAQNDFYEASALVTAANTVVQDPSKVGAGKFMPEHIVICGFVKTRK